MDFEESKMLDKWSIHCLPDRTRYNGTSPEPETFGRIDNRKSERTPVVSLLSVSYSLKEGREQPSTPGLEEPAVDLSLW